MLVQYGWRTRLVCQLLSFGDALAELVMTGFHTILTIHVADIMPMTLSRTFRRSVRI